MSKGTRATGGIALRTLQWILRFVEFGCAAVILALFSYFLAKLSSNHFDIPNHMRAIEGISGVAVLYTILAVLLVCCLGGLGFFALLAFILDILFCGGFIYIAIKNAGGAHSCSSGNVNTWLGSGNVDSEDSQGSLPSLKNSCRMETACFAVAIVGAFFFLLSAFVEIALWRHHKAEKKYGPSPANGYTAGSGKKRFWQRRNRGSAMAANDNALPYHTTPADARTSHTTDNTMVGTEERQSKYGSGVPMTGATGATGNKHHVGRDVGLGAGALAAEKHHHNKHDGTTGTGLGHNTQQYAAPHEPYGSTTNGIVAPTHGAGKSAGFTGGNPNYNGQQNTGLTGEIPVSQWREKEHVGGGSGAYDNGGYTSPRGTAL